MTHNRSGVRALLSSLGTGSEVMQRIAVSMIGGKVSSTVLTLAVIPAIYSVMKGFSLPVASSEEGLAATMPR